MFVVVEVDCKQLNKDFNSIQEYFELVCSKCIYHVPCILLLQDIDSICGNSTSSGSSGSSGEKNNSAVYLGDLL